MNLEVLVVEDYDLLQFLHKETLSMAEITNSQLVRVKLATIYKG